MRSLQLDLALDFVREAEPAEGDQGPSGKLLVSLELALGERLAHRLLDFALGAHAERLEKSSNAGVENILVHDRLLGAIIRAMNAVAALAVARCQTR